MPIQIDGKAVGAIRVARDDGNLATVGEARAWDGGAWKIVWQGKDAIERLNPRHYYQLNGSWVDYMGSRNLAVNSSRASVGSEFATFHNYTGSRYAEITNLPAGNTGDSYTIAMWMRPTNSSNYPAFFARGTGSSNSIDVYAGTTGVSFDTASDTGTSINAPYVLNQWQHFVMRITHETTSRTGVELWYNGQPMGTSTFSRGSRHSSSDSLRIGSEVGGSYPFRGDMDTVVYFDRALTNAEVLSIYSAGRL